MFDAIARDPTGTDDLRRAFERELKDRWQRLDKCLYKAVGVLDSLGLAQGPLALIPAADRMKHFRSWLDELLSHLIVSGGDWMATYLDEAGERASSRAASLDPRKAAGGGLPTAPRIAGQLHDYDPDEERNERGEWSTGQTGTPEFRAWFGESKIVNEHGKPQVVYHGTSDDFDTFDLNSSGRKDTGWLGKGVYMTTSPDIASSYASLKPGSAGQNVMPLFAKVENPYYATEQDKQRLMTISQRDKWDGLDAAEAWTKELQV